MSFWEELTVEQMGILLVNRGRPGMQEGWDGFLEPLYAVPPNEDSDNANFILSNCPRTPAAYFFLTVAAVCEEDGGVTFEELDRRYLPPLGRDASREDAVREETTWQCLKRAVVDRNKTDDGWLEELYGLLGQEGRPEKGDSLRKLLDWVEQVNRDRYAPNEPERPNWHYERSMERGFPKLRGLLDQWEECGDMWDSLSHALAEEALAASPEAVKAAGLLRSGVRQIIFTGAPGTGKTYAAKLLARAMGASLPGMEEYVLVQFHPSYDYTDFVEGLRPVQGPDGQVSFVKLDGEFKKFCRQVARQGRPDRRYFFLVDEINRADLSKVFGELMYCLEADKRGSKNRVRTQYNSLPYYDPETGGYQEDAVFGKGFFIPENVVLIGTMNDIDRSVESMDFALRRRFEWMEFVVTADSLAAAFRAFPQPALKNNADELARRVDALNQVVCPKDPGAESLGRALGLNRQYYISQGQFANLPRSLDEAGTAELLAYVWKYRIRSLLREYLRGEDEEKAGELIKKCREALGVREADD